MKREDRLARNEALFRAVNERVQAERLGEGEELISFICECGDENCVAEVDLTRAEYEGIRSDAVQFVIVPGHEIPDIETTVAEKGRYAIARKHPGEQDIARETDPRS
jgi:hypothetical protein